MSFSSNSTPGSRMFIAVMILAGAAMAILESQSHAQSKPAADSDAHPHLPYGVIRQEHGSRLSPETTKPIGVTESLGESEPPPSTNAKPNTKAVSQDQKIAASVPLPPNPLWHSPDSRSVGVESADDLGRKYHLPAQPHGLNHVSPIGWLSVVGLLGLVAVAVVLSQRNERGRHRKSSRRSSRPAP